MKIFNFTFYWTSLLIEHKKSFTCIGVGRAKPGFHSFSFPKSSYGVRGFKCSFTRVFKGVK